MQEISLNPIRTWQETFESEFEDFESALTALSRMPMFLDTNDPGCKRFLSIVRHALFLLRDGELVFCAHRLYRTRHSGVVLLLDRITIEDGTLTKTLAKLSMQAQPPDSRTFQQHTNGPSILLYRNPVRVIHDERVLSPLSLDLNLSFEDLLELYSNKARNAETAGAARRVEFGSTEVWRRADRKFASGIVKDADYIAPLEEGQQFSTREAHPYCRPMLHILPRLIIQRGNVSIFEAIESQLQEIRTNGFGGILLGVVDPQSVSAYYSEQANGELVPFANNHGYWISGESGIDRSLGTCREYGRLVARTKELGMTFAQDSVIATMGYPAQVRRLSTSNLDSPTSSLALDNTEAMIFDPCTFLQDTWLAEEDSADDHEFNSVEYVDCLVEAHFGRPFELPRPNIFDPEILSKILSRMAWQIESSDVSGFRIDMAKHIGIDPLRNMIDELRRVVKSRPSSGTGGEAPLVAILEYWSTSYKDLRFAADILKDRSAGVYMLDFPLASMLRDVLIGSASFGKAIKDLIAARGRWRIDLLRLIPTFVDHDRDFRPLYNGSIESQAQLVVGYALCVMLSANAPIVYFQYENAHAGKFEDDCSLSSEQSSRQWVSQIFSKADSCSPAALISTLFKTIEQHGFLQNWDCGEIVVTGDGDCAVIARGYIHAATERRSTVRAYFWRTSVDYRPSDTEEIVYNYTRGPSVAIVTAR